MDHEKVYIIIPVYNEECKVIQEVVERVQSAGYRHIIVVDDGSIIKCSQQLQRFSHVTYARHAINRGKGAAVYTGMMIAKNHGATIVVTMDGDGQHDASDIKKLVDIVHAGTDVALGYRLGTKGEMPLIKQIANHSANFFTWVFFGLWVRDSQSGFRAYGSRALEQMTFQSDSYAFDSEVIREIARHGLSYEEVPIMAHYTKYSMNKETKQTIVGGLKTLSHFLKIK